MPNLSKIGFPDKVAGDTLTAAELNEIKLKFNLLVDFVNAGTAVTPPTSGTGTDVTVMIMSGQSNCLGVGRMEEIATTALRDVTPSITREFQRVEIWNASTQTFQKLQAGVNNLGYGQAFGAEIGFAQRWEDMNPTETLYIIKYYRDGRPIQDWQKGGPIGGYEEMLNSYVNAALAALVADGKNPITKGLWWMQGESNAGDTDYANKLQTFTNNLTLDSVINQGTKVVIGKVRSDATIAAQDIIYVNNNPVIARLVDTQNWGMNSDNLHYNAMGQYLGGYTDIYNAVYSLNTVYPFAMNAGPTNTNTPPATGIATLLSTSPNITYSNAFQAALDGGVGWEPSAVFTNAQGQYFEFTFTGNKIDFYGQKFSGAQRFIVTIDNVVVDADFIIQPGNLSDAYIIYTKTIPNGTHTVRFTCFENPNYLVFSKIILNDATSNDNSNSDGNSTDNTYLADDSRISYSGLFQPATNSNGGWEDNAVYSNITNDYFEFPFTGSKLDFYGMEMSATQSFKVSIDGVVVDTFAKAAGGNNSPVVIYSRTVSDGNHTVRFTSDGGFLIMSKVVVS